MRNILKKRSQIDAVLAATGLADDSNPIGGAAGTGVSAKAAPAVVQQIVTFVNAVVPLVDNPGVGASGSFNFFTFAAGQINIIGAVANLALTKSSTGVNATWNGDFGVGTVAADNSATLTATEQDVIASTSTPAAVAGATTAKGKLATADLVDGSVTPVELFLNLLVDDADQDVTTTPCNLIVNGTITLTYANNGVA
jgi:hypothetical protein